MHSTTAHAACAALIRPSQFSHRSHSEKPRRPPSLATKSERRDRRRQGQLLEDFSLLDLLVVVVSPPGAALFEVVVEDSEDFSEAEGAAGAAAAP